MEKINPFGYNNGKFGYIFTVVFDNICTCKSY